MNLIINFILTYFILFNALKTWINKNNKSIKAIRIGKKDDKIKLLVKPFKIEYRVESEIYKSKAEATSNR